MKPRCSLNRGKLHRDLLLSHIHIHAFHRYRYPPLNQDFSTNSPRLRGRATFDCIADVTVIQQQTLCSSPSALHLPAQTHLTCRMQQPHTASHTLAHKTNHLSTIVTPDLWSNPFGHAWSQKGTKAFHSFYPQTTCTERTEDRGSSIQLNNPETFRTELFVHPASIQHILRHCGKTRRS